MRLNEEIENVLDDLKDWQVFLLYYDNWNCYIKPTKFNHKKDLIPITEREEKLKDNWWIFHIMPTLYSTDLNFWNDWIYLKTNK